MPPIVEMRSIDKRFPGVHALAGVDFTLHPGEIHALLGENGAGKSTLMKVLGGLYKPDGGEILLDGKPVVIDSPSRATQLGIGFIHQELNLANHLTVAENIYLGRPPVRGPLGLIDWKRMRAEARTVLERLGTNVDPGARVDDLSVGTRQMIEIAKALALDARVLIMDEPTAALTESESERLAAVVRSLAAAGVAIVYISHRLEEIFKLCHKVTVLRDGRYAGSATVADTSTDKLITLMVGRELTERFPKVEVQPGAPLLTVKGLTRPGMFNDVSFTLRQGEILGFAGLMGAGRSEVMRAIAGIDPVSSGSVVLGDRPLPARNPAAAIEAGLALVPEDRKKQGLVTGRSVKENVTLAVLHQLTNSGLIQGSRETALVDRFIRELGIRTPNREQSVSLLSGGNQQKVILARWLATGPRVLILDEPTRGIDIGAKAEIYKLMGQLVQKGIGIILVSSELPEVLGLSDRILVMHQGRLTGEFQRGQADQELIMRAATGRIEHAG
jgi:ribose transport system ATP-binding protein